MVFLSLAVAVYSTRWKIIFSLFRLFIILVLLSFPTRGIIDFESNCNIAIIKVSIVRFLCVNIPNSNAPQIAPRGSAICGNFRDGVCKINGAQ